MGFRILLLLFYIAMMEAGFVQDNQNIFYGHSSEAFESAPISYQYFVNYGKFSNSDINSVDVQSTKPITQSNSLFKTADYDEQAAYTEEVESAHRVALAKRENNTDAAYMEAYTEALKAQRRSRSGGAKINHISHQLQNQFGFNTEHSYSRLLSAKSKSNHFRSHYEDEGKGEYHFTHGNHNRDLRKSVEYTVDTDYDQFNANGAVHRQPQNIAETSEIQFTPPKYSSSPAINYYA